MAQRNILRLLQTVKTGYSISGRSYGVNVVKNCRSYYSKHLYQCCRQMSQQQGTPPQTPPTGPKILSTLFPQTAIDAKAEEEAREEKQREEQEKKEKEKSNKRMKIGMYVFAVSAGVMAVWTVIDFGAPETDAEGKVIEDEFSNLPIVEQYFRRMWKSLTYYQKIIQEPSAQRLLPDPLKYPYIQPKYTLVLEMKGLLVHPDWTYKTGWRFKKRPGVDQFLEQLARHFEIVVYTADQGITVFPILDALDPNGYIMYRLVRDATHFVDGHHVKNLDNINRDLKRVIVVDWDPNSVKLHPDNAFVIPKWDGNDHDTTLLELVAFLKTVATSDVDDVREVLHYYREFSNPLEKFKDNLRKLQEIEEKDKEEKKKQGTPAVKKWSPSLFQKK
uniref:Mitochondrial import inner membrane translocase subunit TIM50 n=1 Tax=Culicoides sonorensis TaxID=179676 RepID=A0A336KV34_CULSO